MQSSRSYTRRITMAAPARFDFWRTVRSHGWCALPPYGHDPERKELTRVLLLTDGTVAHATLSNGGNHIRVETRSAVSMVKHQISEITSQLATCLRMDEDFSEFHRAAQRHPEYRWIARTGSGRMLRSPSVFEDVVKMICTTNCTWELTTLMVSNLVQSFGKPLDSSARCFPTPDALAGSTERYVRKHIKAGYRSPFLIELADRVASGKLDLESWKRSLSTTDVLFDEMRAVKGVGPYAAGNIMKLVGRYDYLGLDSWVRKKYYELHTKGRKVQDSTIEKRYMRYGNWRGLFFWLEMTRYWHADKFAL